MKDTISFIILILSIIGMWFANNLDYTFAFFMFMLMAIMEIQVIVCREIIIEELKGGTKKND